MLFVSTPQEYSKTGKTDKEEKSCLEKWQNSISATLPRGSLLCGAPLLKLRLQKIVPILAIKVVPIMHRYSTHHTAHTERSYLRSRRSVKVEIQ